SLPRPRGRVGVGASRDDAAAPSARPHPRPPPHAGGGAKQPHIARSASVTGSVAARNAGNRPPTKPIASAHFRPSHSSPAETRNSKLRLATPPARVDAV